MIATTNTATIYSRVDLRNKGLSVQCEIRAELVGNRLIGDISVDVLGATSWNSSVLPDDIRAALAGDIASTIAADWAHYRDQILDGAE